MARTSLLRSASQGSADFDSLLARLARRGETDLDRVEPVVREIIAAVRAEGDVAVRRYVERFEKGRPEKLFDRDYGGEAALLSLSPSVAKALRTAADRIRRYHERQAEQLQSFEYEAEGVRLGGRVQAVERAGIYVPGGKALYPSSVLMCAVPARVAGVSDILVACPDASREVLAACHLAGVTGLLRAGGAQGSLTVRRPSRA
jgi:histidinol dehydrogenase